MMRMKNSHVLMVQCQFHLQVSMMTIVTVLMEQMNQVLILLFCPFFPLCLGKDISSGFRNYLTNNIGKIELCL